MTEKMTEAGRRLLADWECDSHPDKALEDDVAAVEGEAVALVLAKVREGMRQWTSGEFDAGFNRVEEILLSIEVETGLESV